MHDHTNESVSVVNGGVTQNGHVNGNMNGKPMPQSPTKPSQLNALIGAEKGERKSQCSDSSSWSFYCFVENVYVPMMKNTYAKVRGRIGCLIILTHSQVLIMLMALGLLGMGIYGTCKLEDGLELSDIIIKGTPEYEFLIAREKYFSFYPMNIIMRTPTDLPEKQAMLGQLRQDVINVHEYTVR
jgi:patched 1 protein